MSTIEELGSFMSREQQASTDVQRDAGQSSAEGVTISRTGRSQKK